MKGTHLFAAGSYPQHAVQDSKRKNVVHVSLAKARVVASVSVGCGGIILPFRFTLKEIGRVRLGEGQGVLEAMRRVEG